MKWFERILKKRSPSAGPVAETSSQATATPQTWETRFATDVADFVIFDPARLRHRLDDDADWPADPDQVIQEVNQGNALVVKLEADGRYGASIHLASPPAGSDLLRALLRSDSGRFYIGPGEEITADEKEPTDARGGTFVSVPPGNYEVHVGWAAPASFEIYLVPTSVPAVNSFARQPALWDRSVRK